ncbi:MAG TPA: hypothetical protein DCL21_03750 [Alphaproteobacteria bacterium]|nr:hypothetical protein [Alphaproteobacteria bacterium]
MIKKGAMFGLEGRVLRKYAGSIFLASLRRLTFRLVAGNQASQKLTAQGAMFGLDARIALAIFGALSVISGAALYSAIQNAKATAFVTGLDELGKAVEAYMLDTGQWPVQNNPAALPTAAQFYDLKLDSLLAVYSISGWDGPYISGFKDGAGAGLEKNTDSYGLVMNVPNDNTWGGSTPWWDVNTSFCTSWRSCNLWLTYTSFSELSTIKKIDELVDSSDGSNDGKVKWFIYPASKYTLMYRLNPIKNPND